MNDCVSQVNSLDPVSEEKKAKTVFLYIVRTVLIEHYLDERIKELLQILRVE